MTTVSYGVEGLTCAYCMAEVLEHVHSLSGVTYVAMDLVRAGQSPLMVTSGTELGVDSVREVVESAGFDLIAADGREVRGGGDGFSAQDGYTHPDRERMTCSIGGVSS